ncbi:MAG: hypothetical protein AABW41_04435 [Nanoarchaeota archaeon]
MPLKLVLVSLIGFFGLIFGMVLGFLTKEELKPGKKYFHLLLNLALLSLIFILITKILSNLFISAIFFLLGILVGYFFRKNYLYFGIAIVASIIIDANLMVLLAGLIFLYGLANGALLTEANLNRHKKIYPIIVSNLVLFALPFAFIAMDEGIKQHYYILFAFSAGALIMSLLKNFQNLRSMEY